MAHHWTPRELLQATGKGEWTMIDDGVKVAIALTVQLNGRTYIRAVSWAPTPEGRALIGYFIDLVGLADIVYREWLRVNGKSTDLPPR